MMQPREPFRSTFLRAVLPMLVLLVGLVLQLRPLLAITNAIESGTHPPASLREGPDSFWSIFSTPGWWFMGVGFTWFVIANVIHYQRLDNERRKGRCPTCGHMPPPAPPA